MGVKSFIKKSVAFVSALAMACSMVVMPAGASYAAEADSGLNLNKSVELQNDGTYKITLSSYATGEYTTVTEKSGVPLDIVLVLDQSGSMDEKVNRVKKIDSLKSAVNSFVTNISNNAKEYNVDHRIALVGYASDDENYNSQKFENTGLFINGTLKKYNQLSGSSDYKNALVNVNTNGSITSSITTAIDNISANGATYTNYGLEMANGVFSNNPIESGSDRKRIVVVFTDGEPGASGYESGIAGFAVNEAYKTKNTYGATVYSVGFYDSADADVTNFMNYISSNYPSAQAEVEEHRQWDIFNGWTTYYTASFTPGDKTGTKYYMKATNQTELNNIFKNISKDIETPSTSVKLDKNAVTRDIITDKLDISDNTKVTAYTEDYKGSDTWKKSANQGALTTSINKDKKTVDVTGFDYAANFVDKTKAKGQRLVVEITGLTATQAGDSMITNVTNKSGVYANKDTENPSEIFNECSISIPSKSYVLDYGKTVSTAAADYGVNAVTIANTGKPSPDSIDLTGDYGTFAISNGALNYTPGKINWDGIDTGYVFGAKSDQSDITTADPSAYKWEEVNFIPATSVYYEDDFGSFTTDNPNQDANVAIVWTGKWSEDSDKLDEGENSKKDNSQSSDNVKYGWDDSYADDNEYSNGSAHYSSDSSAKATFRFTGTGVDVYSRTTPTEGRVIAKIKRVVKGENGSETLEAVKTSIIDNQSVSGNYYQIPTLTFDNLTYGTYEVTIMVSPITSENRLVYYLDGIRVYNPLQGNVTAEEIYQEVGEGNAQYIQVRKDLLDTSKVTAIDSEISGSVFIDKSKDTVGDSTNAIGTYETYGPKNEVYLKSDEKSTQGVAFTIKNYNPNVNKVFIGLKSPTGNKVTAEITSGKQKVTKDISSASDLYYEITPTADGKVVIKNTTNNLLSITKIRITTSNSASAQSYSLRATPELMSYVDEFDTLEVKEETTEDKDTTLDKDDVEIDNPTEDNNAEEGSNTSNSIWQKIMNSINKWFR